MLAGQLIQAGYQVVTGGDSRTAGSSGADYLVTGPVEVRTGGSGQVYGMTMQELSATFSCRVIEAASGQVKFSDSSMQSTRAKSGDSARQIVLQRTVAQIARGIAARIPKTTGGYAPNPPPQYPPVAEPTPVESIDPGPRIVMINPPEGRGIVRAKKRLFTIQGQALDSSGIQSVTIDRTPVATDSQGRFSHEVTLGPRENRFTIVATNHRRRSATKEVRIPFEADTPLSPQPERQISGPGGPKPDLWGLVIGVSRYRNSRINLRFADRDALALESFLKSQEGGLYSRVHIRSLVNEQVTRDSILAQVGSHLGQAAPNDVVFIFVAGHGIQHRQTGSYYFVPYDATYDTLLSRGLRTSDFEEAVNILSRNVGKVIIVMDTCHSGAMNATARSFGPGENLAEIMRFSSGLFILSASKSGEQSYEDGKYRLHSGDTGHGAFTYALMKGMSGDANHDRDGYISVGELFQYVSKQVPRLTGGLQHPFFRLQGTDMPFFVSK